MVTRARWPAGSLSVACAVACATALVASVRPAAALVDLFTELDARLPTGYYRGPSLVTTPAGTLLAFVLGALHRHDGSPTIVYVRRSRDDGSTWTAAAPVLLDPSNRTHYTGAAIVDPSSGAVHFVFQQDVAGAPAAQCGGCLQHVTTSHDDGVTWSVPAVVQRNTSQRANATWGKALQSGIVLARGPRAGRMLYALRHDCGCGDLKSSFVIYSDDRGATWSGGAHLMLLPQFGGGYTECQVTELHNGSVLLTSRNSYGRSSGQGPRLFARSDDGGESWAANWSAGADLPDPYCEASIVSSADGTEQYFANPSNGRARGNFSLHRSTDGGRTWPASRVLYPGPAAYSDVSRTRNQSVGFLFERDNYRYITFGTTPLAFATGGG